MVTLPPTARDVLVDGWEECPAPKPDVPGQQDRRLVFRCARAFPRLQRTCAAPRCAR